MNRLGVIGAMAVEVASLKQQMQGLTVLEHAGMTFYRGVLNGLESVVVECGVGKVNAALCVQVLCDLFAVTHIVNTGVAGSMCNDLDIGDFVISRDVIHHDFDCSGLGYAIGQVPGLPVHRFTADEKLLAMAQNAANFVHPGHVLTGTVASGDQFVSSREVKERIKNSTGALCTEMEGAAIAQAAWRNGVPFVVIRAISDKADDTAQMDYPVFEAIAAKHCAEVTMTLAGYLCEEN